MKNAKKKANKDTKSWRYEIEGVSQGVQGTYLIKVWSFSKTMICFANYFHIIIYL